MTVVEVTGTRIILDSELQIDAALTIAINHEYSKVDVVGTTANKNAERGMLFAALSELEPDPEMSRWYRQLSSTALLLAKDDEELIRTRYIR